MKKAVLVGCTGLVGKQLMYKLIESQHYDVVIVLVRAELPIKHSKIKQLIVDFDKLSDFKDQLVADDFFCCLGTTMKKAGSKEAFYKVDYTYCYEFGKIASYNHAKSFNLVSAIGSDSNSKIFYSKVKGQLEQDLEKLNLTTFNIFQPSFLLSNRTEFRLGEKLGAYIASLFSALFIGSLRKYKPIHAAQVANAILKAAQKKQSEKTTKYDFDKMMELQ